MVGLQRLVAPTLGSHAADFRASWFSYVAVLEERLCHLVEGRGVGKDIESDLKALRRQ